MNTHPIKKILDAACRIYAVSTILLCLVILLFAEDELVVAPLPFLLLFPFAVCLAWANGILHSERFSGGIRVLLHFLLVTAGVVFFLLIPAGTFASGRSALVMVSLYLLTYGVVMAVIAIVRRIILHRREAEEI